jgi:carboxyl-terminal processing protease
VLIDTFSLAGLDDRVSEELRKLTAEGPLDGLILDVRSNSGGQVGLMLNTIGLFVDGGSIGRGQGRQRAYDLNVPDGRAIAELSETPIAVLSGEDSISAGEIFASGMQTLGRAQIVGLPSAGNTENLIAEDFSDGSRLWLAELIFYRPDGTTIEGAGVQPDVRVDAEWWRYDLINDPQVQAAVDLIEKG